MVKFAIRLDDGSLIGRANELGVDPASSAVVRITVDQAAKLGKAGDKEVARLQDILARLRAQYPQIARPAPQQAREPPSKKPKLETVPSLQVSQGPGMAWQAKCREVFDKLLKHLGSFKDGFYNPVNPQVLPDYYNVIKSPLFLRDIDQRLVSGYYQAPNDFVADIRHHFSNVKLYNPEGDPYRKAGIKAEEMFDQWWAATGLSQERSRRATAGMAAPKFDPEVFEPPSKPAKATRSHQGNGMKRPRDATGRSMSHEVTSGLPGMHGEGLITHNRPSAQRLAEISAYLSRDDLPDEHSNFFLTLLPPALTEGITTGEVELDFDSLDDDTLWRVDAWLRTLPDAAAFFGHAPPHPGMVPGQHMGHMPPPAHAMHPGHFASPPLPAPSGVRVDSYGDDDDDYEIDEDDESD